MAKRKPLTSEEISAIVDGFEPIEVSPNHYQIEGNDESGHSVSRSCSEFEIKETLEKCANDARDIQKQVQENK
jgi:hypothetical protein